MRFAYIDSHGNEVPIPSVDALALRIELGAVGPDTQLYDAQADHWGPARTHEIFHTLSREADGEGFVAPPPPVAPPPQAPSRPAAAPGEKPAKPATAKKEPKKKKQGAPPADVDLGLTLAAPPPGPASQKKGGADAGPDLSFDLVEPPPSKPAAPAKGGPPKDVGGRFDFGDLGGGLELEEHDSMGLERPMEFTTGGLETGGGDLLLETPMSEFRPDSPPGWMEGPSDDQDVLDFSSVSAETATEGEEEVVPSTAVPAPERRAPKARPSPPKFNRRRSLSGPIVLVVILLALGVGGYVGWPILSARLAQPEVTERPPVVMPAISAELLPRMQALAAEAIADVVQGVDAATVADGPPEPAQEWLSGMYLGNASQFASIEAFWEGLDRFVQQLRDGDWQVYHDALVMRVEAAGVTPEEAAIIVARADSGLVAAQDARTLAYDAMERLAVAALDLHDFLVLNEESIEYRPANSSTVDPVLEAVPATPALGDQMWGMVDEITESLDALGSLDRVTRARLTAAMQERLQEVGVQ